ncbi:YodL domain-containing protein [Enterocloster clostridioformis]
MIPRFRVTTVFDVSQTDGKPLPEFGIEDLTASVENYEAFMQAITSVSPVPIRYDEIEGESHGYYHLVDKEIVIQSGMSESQTMKTAIHEVSHAKLHDREIMEELGIQKDKLTREVEAESIAYCVCQYFGLDTSEYSFPYIGSWSSGKDMRELRSSMDTIRKTAGEFIDSMTAQLQEILRDGPEIEEIRMDDVVLRISGSMGSDYEYCVVKNMTVGQAEDAFVENDVSLEEYLEERGAKVTAIYASNGLGEDYPVDFFDVEYDVDTGIAVLGELGAQRQAEMLIAKLEYNKTVFTDVQRNLITNYAYKFDNVERARFLMEAIMQAHEETNTRAIFTVMQAAQEEIDSLPDSMVGLSEMHQSGYQRDNMLPVKKERAHELFQEGYEIFALYLDDTTAELEDEAEIDAYEGMLGVHRETWERYHSMEKKQGEREKEPDRTNEDLLLNGEDNYYGIYQIDHDGEGARYSFMNMAELNRNGVAAERSDYNLVYVGRLKKSDTLDSLYEKFNIHHPADFTGHSLSVSDVVLLHQAGENRAYFVDSFGFTEVPGFFLEKKWELDVAEENREMVFKVSDRMIGVRMARDGFDFQIYDEHYNMVEKGHYDDPALPMEDIALDVVRDRSGSIFDRDTHKSYRPYAWGHMHLDDELVEVDREGFHNELDAANARLDAAAVTERTFQLEVEGHSGTWHTVEAREIMNEMFYRMEHDTYGDSVAGILVNAEGELVAQDLEHGFDRGAMEAIREYFVEKGIEWEPETQEQPRADVLGETVYPPVYSHTLAYAMEHGAADEYLDSRKLNIDCKKAVEDAIRSHFDGMHLAADAVDTVLAEYGGERLSYVLACTVQYKESDGRFSRDTKAWAASISVPENISRGIDLLCCGEPSGCVGWFYWDCQG